MPEKCVICEEEFEECFTYSEKLNGYVCESCYYSELNYPQGTVRIFKPSEGIIETYEVYSVEDRLHILEIEDITNFNWDYGEYVEDEICPIQFKWVRTGSWRGYYAPDTDEWVDVHEDCFLGGSVDAGYLENFNDLAIAFLWNLGVEFAVVTARTSNLFSMGYDLMVHKSVAENLETFSKVTAKLAELKYHYRDPVRFTLTAITGKDKFEERDYILLDAWNMIKDGFTVDEIVERLKGKLTGVHDYAETEVEV
ncbi:MAG: hypothetical protein ACTSPB_03105 [Candidatus Thorarchaeota archaeon]